MSAEPRTLASSQDELYEAAACNTGLNDFGDPSYREGLDVLLEAFDADMQLTEVGREAIYRTIVNVLSARLHTNKGWADNPEFLTAPINRPLVITGLPRTGSTALHKLLSVDSQFQTLEYWLSITPMVRPSRGTWITHPRYRACVAELEAAHSRTPDFRKAHNFVPDEAEECNPLLVQDFCSHIWSLYNNLPTYSSWLRSKSALDSYRRYVNILRLIGGDEPNKRWLLKCPNHMVNIDVLLDVLPDAYIIQTHRDPLKVIPSVCSLQYMVARDLEGESARRGIIGPRHCSHWHKALDNMEEARRKRQTQFFDVDHRRFAENPLRVLRSIYDYFSLTLSRNTEEKMREWTQESPTSKHGKHEYQLDSWGVTPAEICETFSDYRAQHGFA